MKIAEYYPKFYDGVREFELIADIDDGLLNQLKDELTTAHANNYVLTANEKAVGIYESALAIMANPTTESLDFRRQRILNRYQMRSPFNLGFLKDRLDQIIGKGKYLLTIDYDHYTMYLEMTIDNFNWFKEANLTINWVKPANIKYIMVPVLIESFQLREQAYVSKIKRFRAGISRAGDKVIDITDEKEVGLS